MSKANKSLAERNAEVLINMLLDPDTPPDLQVKVMQKLMAARKENTFFASMFKEMISFGNCPSCGHQNFWCIPEDELNKIGWVTSDRDKRVPKKTTAVECPKWAQACMKKKLTV